MYKWTVTIGQAVFLALGILTTLPGIYALVKFRRDLVAPSSDDHRKVRLPFLLWTGTWILAGAAWIVFSFTGSWFALFANPAVFVTRPLIARLGERRLDEIGPT